MTFLDEIFLCIYTYMYTYVYCTVSTNPVGYLPEKRTPLSHPRIHIIGTSICVCALVFQFFTSGGTYSLTPYTLHLAQPTLALVLSCWRGDPSSNNKTALFYFRVCAACIAYYTSGVEIPDFIPNPRPRFKIQTKKTLYIFYSRAGPLPKILSKFFGVTIHSTRVKIVPVGPGVTSKTKDALFAP